MALIEWDSLENQLRLLELLQTDGKEIPHNLVTDSAIRFTIAQRYPVSRMRYFSTACEGESSPTYVFVFEENSKAFSNLYARPPPRGHDEHLLHSALSELIEKIRGRLEKEGEMLVMTDAVTRHVLRNLLSSVAPVVFDLDPPSPVEVFYMTDEQMRMVEEIELQQIPGFHADSVNLNGDATTIHDNWIHSATLESTTARLRHLPASVVRESSTGAAVSWEMSSPFGQCSNLFTIPEYRGKGLALLAEMHLVKSYVSQGLRPFKYIDFDNWNMLAATRRHQLWTNWEEKNESMKKSEGAPFPMFFTTIKKRE